jgi:hypothetical protein
MKRTRLVTLSPRGERVVRGVLATLRKDGRRYYAHGLPRTVPAGRVLAHNHVRHTAATAQGVRGFRCWTWPQDQVPRHWEPCPCGWAGLPHYALLPAGREAFKALIERLSQEPEPPAVEHS